MHKMGNRHGTKLLRAYARSSDAQPAYNPFTERAGVLLKNSIIPNPSRDLTYWLVSRVKDQGAATVEHGQCAAMGSRRLLCDGGWGLLLLLHLLCYKPSCSAKY